MSTAIQACSVCARVLFLCERQFFFFFAFFCLFAVCPLRKVVSDSNPHTQKYAMPSLTHRSPYSAIRCFPLCWYGKSANARFTFCSYEQLHAIVHNPLTIQSCFTTQHYCFLPHGDSGPLTASESVCYARTRVTCAPAQAAPRLIRLCAILVHEEVWIVISQIIQRFSSLVQQPLLMIKCTLLSDSMILLT